MMTCTKGSIAEARIYGLERCPVWDKTNKRYILPINLSSNSTEFNLPVFVVGSTQAQAQRNCEKIKSRFMSAQIFDNSVVNVIFNEHGYVRAIRSKRSFGWLDLRDKLKLKTNRNLNISLRSLAVVC